MARRRFSWRRPARRVAETAVAVAERGAGLNRAISPKISPGPSTATRFSRPSAAVRPSLILPDMIT